MKPSTFLLAFLWLFIAAELFAANGEHAPLGEAQEVDSKNASVLIRLKRGRGGGGGGGRGGGGGGRGGGGGLGRGSSSSGGSRSSGSRGGLSFGGSRSSSSGSSFGGSRPSSSSGGGWFSSSGSSSGTSSGSSSGRGSGTQTISIPFSAFSRGTSGSGSQGSRGSPSSSAAAGGKPSQPAVGPAGNSQAGRKIPSAPVDSSQGKNPQPKQPGAPPPYSSILPQGGAGRPPSYNPNVQGGVPPPYSPNQQGPPPAYNPSWPQGGAVPPRYQGAPPPYSPNWQQGGMSNPNLRPPPYQQQPGGGWGARPPPRGQGIYMASMQPAHQTIVVVPKGPSYYSPPPSRMSNVMSGLLGYQLGLAVGGSPYYHHRYPYYYHYAPPTRYVYVKETDRYYYYGEDSYTEIRGTDKSKVSNNVTDEATQALFPETVALRCTYGLNESTNITNPDGSSVKDIVFECDKRTHVCCELDCCWRTDVNFTALVSNFTEPGSESGRNNLQTTATCKAPYKLVGAGAEASCAWLDDTATSAVPFDRAESSCQKIGGRVLTFDSREKSAWLKAQKRQNPCWYGPRQETGCAFVFTDNTSAMDADCDGSRGFLRYSVKCYACEAAAMWPSRDEEATSTSSTSSTPTKTTVGLELATDRPLRMQGQSEIDQLTRKFLAQHNQDSNLDHRLTFDRQLRPIDNDQQRPFGESTLERMRELDRFDWSSWSASVRSSLSEERKKFDAWSPFASRSKDFAEFRQPQFDAPHQRRHRHLTFTIRKLQSDDDFAFGSE